MRSAFASTWSIHVHVLMGGGVGDLVMVVVVIDVTV